MAISAWQARELIGDVSGGGAVVSGSGSTGDATLTMAQTVAAGSEWQVELYVGGVRQRPGIDYTCDGTTTLTLHSWSLSTGEEYWILHTHGPS